MNINQLEPYQPRTISNQGVFEIEHIRFKVYGLVAKDKHISREMLVGAKSFINKDVLPRVLEEGGDNGLGYIIIHPGDNGISTSVYWWIEGSVLCQQIQRQLYGSDVFIDTIKRPVIACIWELAIINAEQEIWRETMMIPNPSSSDYLAKFCQLKTA